MLDWLEVWEVTMRQNHYTCLGSARQGLQGVHTVCMHTVHIQYRLWSVNTQCIGIHCVHIVCRPTPCARYTYTLWRYASVYEHTDCMRRPTVLPGSVLTYIAHLKVILQMKWNTIIYYRQLQSSLYYIFYSVLYSYNYKYTTNILFNYLMWAERWLLGKPA